MYIPKIIQIDRIIYVCQENFFKRANRNKEYKKGKYCMYYIQKEEKNRTDREGVKKNLLAVNAVY